MHDHLVVARAMAGGRILFHVAADYPLWARKPEEILHNNKEGTRVLMQTALAQGVERIIYTSSVATIACSADGRPADETMKQSSRCAIGAYKQSKIAAERIVEEVITSQDLSATIVHPTAPIGPWDQRPTPTGRIVLETASGRIPGFVDTGHNLVHVDDVANGHLATPVHTKPGVHYILGGQNVTFADFLTEIAALCGREPPKLRLPRHLMYPFALAAEALAHVTSREPFLTVDGLRMSKHCMFFSSAKAERDLGYKARPDIPKR